MPEFSFFGFLRGLGQKENLGPYGKVTYIPGSIEALCTHPAKDSAIRSIQGGKGMQDRFSRLKQAAILGGQGSLFTHYILDDQKIGQREVNTLQGWYRQEPLQVATALGVLVGRYNREMEVESTRDRYKLGFVLADLLTVIPVEASATLLKAMYEPDLHERFEEFYPLVPTMHIRTGRVVNLQESAAEMWTFLSPQTREEILKTMVGQGRQDAELARRFIQYYSTSLNTGSNSDAKIALRRNLPDDQQEQDRILADILDDQSNWRRILGNR